jgi:hypothetical protein
MISIPMYFRLAALLQQFGFKNAGFWGKKQYKAVS